MSNLNTVYTYNFFIQCVHVARSRLVRLMYLVTGFPAERPDLFKLVYTYNFYIHVAALHRGESLFYGAMRCSKLFLTSGGVVSLSRSLASPPESKLLG